MKIVLTGGGTGGHITPLLAVAQELKRRNGEIEIIAICERGSSFAHLLFDEPSISAVYQIKAGKLRRFGGQSIIRSVIDIKSNLYNLRDSGYTVQGIWQSWRLLKRLNPDVIFIKGGFVGVPVGLAAAKLKIPFITHDSDTTPGLANRIIARWAYKHATGMPVDFYPYPASKTVFSGIPVSAAYKLVTATVRQEQGTSLGLSACKEVIAITGGSQGADKLNSSFGSIVARLMQQRKHLGIIHIVGTKNEAKMQRFYANELLADEQRRLVVRGFVSDLYRYSAAADLIVTRASATSLAEFGIQRLPCIVVPANLAGGHQVINARHLKDSSAVEVVDEGDSEALYREICRLLDDPKARKNLAAKLSLTTKPQAAEILADMIIETASTDKKSGDRAIKHRDSSADKKSGAESEITEKGGSKDATKE